MRYLYGASDEKFIKPVEEQSVHDVKPLGKYTFQIHPILRLTEPFNKDDVPILFKTTPDTLLNLCTKVVDDFKLPSVYEWSNKDVCNWVHRYGYHHYQNTFRVNMITGRKLLLIDAPALAAMNIKNFEEIKHIAYGIRQLFYFEMTKFMHSISLPREYYYELYKVFMVKTGRRYDLTRRSDLWRQMQLIRPKTKNFSHWELLERWLQRDPDPEFREVIGGARRRHLYACKPAPPTAKTSQTCTHIPCSCIPPCSCYWTKEYLHTPTVFTVLKNRKPDPDFRHKCEGGMPPCTCYWSSKKYVFSTVITCLQMSFPHKYGPLGFNRPSCTLASLLSVTDY